MKIKGIIVIILINLVMTIEIYGYNNTLYKPSFYNPFNLYNRIYGNNYINFHHTLFFEASSFSYGSFYKGIYLNSMQYKINKKLTSYIHIGEEMGYYNINNYSFNKKNFIYSASLYYHPSKKINLKIEYGVTPYNIGSFYYEINPPITTSMSLIINNLINKNSSLTITVNYKRYK